MPLMLPLACLVAPRVGAWIETNLGYGPRYYDYVAPRVGAWIETSLFVTNDKNGWVAPRVGAWIETDHAC